MTAINVTSEVLRIVSSERRTGAEDVFQRLAARPAPTRSPSIGWPPSSGADSSPPLTADWWSYFTGGGR